MGLGLLTWLLGRRGPGRVGGLGRDVGACPTGGGVRRNYSQMSRRGCFSSDVPPAGSPIMLLQVPCAPPRAPKHPACPSPTSILPGVSLSSPPPTPAPWWLSRNHLLPEGHPDGQRVLPLCPPNTLETVSAVLFSSRLQEARGHFWCRHSTPSASRCGLVAQTHAQPWCLASA